MLMSRWLPRLRARLRILFERQRLERELDAELRFHNDQQASEYLKQGLSSDEAVRAARSDREPRLHRGAGGVAREGTHARRRGLPPIAYAGVPTLVALLPGDVPRAEGIRRPWGRAGDAGSLRRGRIHGRAPAARHRHSARARRDPHERPRALRSTSPRVRWCRDRHWGDRGRRPDVVAAFTTLRRRSVGSIHVRGGTGPARRACHGRRMASGSSRNDARSSSSLAGGMTFTSAVSSMAPAAGGQPCRSRAAVAGAPRPVGPRAPVSGRRKWPGLTRPPRTNPSSTRKTSSVTRLAGAPATGRSPPWRPAQIIDQRLLRGGKGQVHAVRPCSRTAAQRGVHHPR